MARLLNDQYIGSMLGGFVSAVFLGTLALAVAGENTRLLILFIFLILVVVIYTAVVFAQLWYKAWKAIQDGHARTTPGKAVGYSFIPIFNIYWLFQLAWGFAVDYNSFIRRHNINAEKLSELLFFSFALLPVLGIVLTRIPYLSIFVILTELILTLVVVSKLCDAINSMSAVPKKVSS